MQRRLVEQQSQQRVTRSLHGGTTEGGASSATVGFGVGAAALPSPRSEDVVAGDAAGAAGLSAIGLSITLPRFGLTVDVAGLALVWMRAFS